VDVSFPVFSLLESVKADEREKKRPDNADGPSGVGKSKAGSRAKTRPDAVDTAMYRHWPSALTRVDPAGGETVKNYCSAATLNYD
jgi:hypothetical protein